MKERRHSGATHSFRLSLQASNIVDNIRHPRRMGGKSRKVSDAIEWYFSPRDEEPSYNQLLQSIAFLQTKLTEAGNEVERLKKLKDVAPTPRWWHRFSRKWYTISDQESMS